MPRIRRTALALALSLAGTGASAEGLEALTERTDLFGWEAVGRLDFDARGFCSAVLVEPDLVLTAAHCLLNADGTPRPVAEMTFHAGLRDGDSVASRRVARAVVLPGYDASNGLETSSVRADAGLVQLANPIPVSTAAPYRIDRLARPGTSVTMLSYGANRANAPSRETGCRYIAAGDGIFGFDCLAEPGSSGAPIFDVSGRRPRIVAIVSGSSTFEDQEIVVGVDALRAYPALRDRLRSGDGVWPKETATARRVTGESPRRASGARFLKP